MEKRAEDEWEVCNEDGFIYKRRKKETSAARAGPATDPTVEMRHMKLLKKRALLKMKEGYIREIKQWEDLSLQLQKMREKSQALAENSPGQPESPLPRLPENNFRPLIDDLLFQAEVQEAILQDFSNLCQMADALCEAEENRQKQALIDLPIWENPLSIMNSLAELEGDANQRT
ncbi:hypothetical protein AMTRI_Chr06g199050 [Amborella trichopoda]|uniref:Uncharacterized protein n=1 Tax=Amborella trichopoda TaxID=13333 RepID=W1Q038_AMBTC|nr:uncharacterized protein LOC18442087 [Amborella trichopoda]ERN13839.1 hypothetical protein AMTR_s00049p00225020 [Amborella trichopoda]|eukprot:XP_006852372.1 uncharacterized protein LOC18442087 [Amborella trichopoda]